MPQSYCPQCGHLSPTLVATRDKLCFSCEQRFELQKEAAKAQIHSANAQAEAYAEAQRQEEEEREEEMLSKKASLLNSLPQEVIDLIASATDEDSTMSAIAQMAEVFKHVDEQEWLWLADRTPFEAAVTYKRLRTSLCPRIDQWWKSRSTLSPSPVPMLKVIAKSLLYTDFDGVKIAGKVLPTAINGIHSEINSIEAEKDELYRAYEKKNSRWNKAIEKVRRSEESLKNAQHDQQQPIDADSVTKNKEKELKKIWPVMGVVFVIIGIGILIHGFTVPGGKGVFGGFCCSSPFLALGGYFAINALRMRMMTADQFKVQLASKSKDEIEAIVKKREKALLSAQDSLTKAKANSESAYQEVRSTQEQIASLDTKLIELKQRITSITEEKLRGRIDPLLKSILDA